MTLDMRLRRTLHAVAEAMPEASPAASHRSRKRVGLLLVTLALPLTAAGSILGPEYIAEMPPKNALFAGDAHGERYWLTPGRVYDDCGFKVSAVELVVEEWNPVGAGWQTASVDYGDPVISWIGTPSASPGPDGSGEVLSGMSKACGVDETVWLADPARFEAGHVKLDDDRSYMIAVHPTVMSVRVKTPTGTETVTTITPSSRPDGPRYAAFDVPESSQVIDLILLDATGQQVGGLDLARPRSDKG